MLQANTPSNFINSLAGLPSASLFTTTAATPTETSVATRCQRGRARAPGDLVRHLTKALFPQRKARIDVETLTFRSADEFALQMQAIGNGVFHADTQPEDQPAFSATEVKPRQLAISPAERSFAAVPWRRHR